MRTKVLIPLFLVSSVAGALLLSSLPRPGGAEAPERPWARLQFVTYADFRAGIFETDTGRLYLYNKGFENPAEVLELVELGKPLKRLTR